jgi:hypothetical protein
MTTEIPRKVKLIQEEIRDIQGLIVGLKEVLKGNPNDELSKLMLSQIEGRSEALITELDQSLVYYGVHSLKWAYQTNENVDIGYIGKVMIELKHCLVEISKTFGKVKKVDDFPLFLDGLYHGSYGLSFSTKHEDAFTNSVFSRSIAAFTGLIEKMTNGQYSDNKEINTRLAHLFERIAEFDCDVKMSYSSAYLNEKNGIYISHEVAARVFNGLSEANNDTKIVTALAVIQGINLLDHALIVAPRERVGVRLKLLYDEEKEVFMIESLGHLCRIEYKQVISEFSHINKKKEDRYIVSINIIPPNESPA